MALQFVVILPKLKHQRCNILQSFPKFSPSTWSCGSLTDRVTKSVILKACLAETKSKASNVEKDPDYRPIANFSPSIWKDTFTSISFRQSEFESYDKQVKELKEKVKEMLMASTENLAENIRLVDSLCRLGVSYHFENEIEKQLIRIFESHANLADDHDCDLHSTALLFRVLRQHGFKMPCGMFNKFRDENGVFKKSLISDVKGMLSLYEATHLSMHGEDILDDALAFTKTHLASLATNSSQHLSLHIIESLEQPLHTDVPRINAHKYISFYEHEESKDDTLLLFAKLDFNRAQLLHRQELSQLTSWWNDLNLKSKYPYMRDRIVEVYWCSCAIYFEPHYRRGRIIYTKIMMFLLLIDDTYDAYATLDELQQLTYALQRWDINVLNQLPDYLKTFYIAFLSYFDQLDDEFSKEGRSYSVTFIKEKYIELVEALLVEAQWFREGFVPPFEECLGNAVITDTCFLNPATVFLGMEEEIAGMNAIQWLQTKPKVVHAAYTVARLVTDIVSHQDEQKRGHVASVVECYMKEYETSREEAVEKLKKMVANAWKDLNEECVRPTTIPIKVLVAAVTNVVRITEVMYKKKNGITNPEYLKDCITKLFVHPLPL